MKQSDLWQDIPLTDQNVIMGTQKLIDTQDIIWLDLFPTIFIEFRGCMILGILQVFGIYLCKQFAIIDGVNGEVRRANRLTEIRKKWMTMVIFRPGAPFTNMDYF